MRTLRKIKRLEHAAALDPVVRPLQRTAARLSQGRARELLHGVWLGHPAHPMLVQLPLGAWMSAAVLDALPGHEAAARRLVQVGLAAAVPAALAGAADWAQQDERQGRVGLVHLGANGAGMLCYLGSLLARARGRTSAGRLLGFAGLTAVGFGGLLGGHISYRQAGGVNHAASVWRRLPDQWRPAVPLAELPEGEPYRYVVDEVPLLLVREGESVHALVDTCAHLGASLAAGNVAEGCVRCPWHGSVFRLADGAVLRGPATAPQPRLHARVRSGRVEVRAAENGQAD